MRTKCRKAEPHELAEPGHPDPMFIIEPPGMAPFTVAFRAGTPIAGVMAHVVDEVLRRYRVEKE